MARIRNVEFRVPEPTKRPFMHDLVQSILESSASRHEQNGGDLLPILAQQTVSDLSLSRLVVWTNTAGDSSKVIQIGPDAEDESSDVIQSAPLGGVRIQDNPSSDSNRRLLSAALLTGPFRITLDVTEGTRAVGSETLSALAEIYADVQRRRILERHLEDNTTNQGIEALIIQLHTCENEEEVANTLATDAASLLQMNRIAVCEKTGLSWGLIATTGVSLPNMRSDAAREICDRVLQAERSPESTYQGDVEAIVVPLHPTGKWEQPHWAAVFETGSEMKTEAGTQANLKKVCTHAALAFDQCRRVLDESFTNRFRRRIKRLLRPAFSSLVLIVVASVLVLTLISTDLTIEVYGELTPIERAFVFAPEDGIVENILVEDGTEVATGQTLCVLVNEEISIQLASIEGELAASNARLTAIDALRGDRNSQASMSLLSAEQAELNAKQKSLAKQATLLQSRLESLTLKSRIDGRVHGDRLRQSLFRRPLLRGQHLFEVASLDAGWELDLQIPETEVRHVLSALTAGDQPLKVSYAVETAPETFHETTLGKLGSSVNVNPQGLLTTLARAQVGDSEHLNERPGAGIVAFIHCGQRSIGYVWLRKVIEFTRRKTGL